MAGKARAQSDMNTNAEGYPDSGDNWREVVYRPLDANKKQIRVFRMRASESFQEDPECELEIVDVDSAAFIAFSYVWGDPADQCLMVLNGFRVEVGRNAHTALRYFRQDGLDELLWLDAICINQKNIDERNQQVPLMREIYYNATDVLHWLGEQTPIDKYAIQALMQMPQAVEDDINSGTSDFEERVEAATSLNAAAWQCVLEFLDKPFWHRLWIVQEISVGSTGWDRSFLQCGRDRMPFWNFRQALHWMYNAIFRCRKDLLELCIEAEDVFRRISVLLTYVSRSALEYNEIAFLNSSLDVSDPRDRIYGLLAILPHLDIQPRYELTVGEVYEDAAFAILRHGKSLDVLLGCDFKAELSSGFPSWVPDWRQSASNTLKYAKWEYLGNDTRIGRYNASAGHSTQLTRSGKALVVQGLRLSTIDKPELLGPDLDAGPNVPVWSLVASLAAAALEFSYDIFERGLLLHYTSREELRADVGRALVLDRHPATHGGDCPGRVGEDIATNDEHNLLERLFGTPTTQASSGNDASKSEVKANDNTDWDSSWCSEMGNRFRDSRFGISSRNELCVFPSNIRPGDSLYILAGLSAPIVLRTVAAGSEPAFRIIGFAYVQGMMDGEALLNATEQVSVKDPEAMKGVFNEELLLI